MPQPYSLDLRRKVLDAYRETGKLLETARRFNVSHDFVGDLITLYEEEWQFQNPNIEARNKI